MSIRTAKIKLSRNKNSQACTRSWSLWRIPAYLRTRSINSPYDKANFLLPLLHPLFSSLFLDVLDSAFSSGINQDKCLGNIVGQWRLAKTGNGSLWSDTDMYFVWLVEFFYRSHPRNSFWYSEYSLYKILRFRSSQSKRTQRARSKNDKILKGFIELAKYKRV